MKVIQVGLGQFGFSWLKSILLPHEQIEIIGIVDKNTSLLEKAKEECNIEQTKLFTDLRHAIASTNPDFILNATPPIIHKEIDLIAFENRIPILSEKPIAEEISHVFDIVRKAEETGVPIMIAENYRYSKVVREAKILLDAGEIGKLSNIQINFCRCHRMENYHKYLKHPLLMDVTIHHIDMIRYLTGEEGKSIFARSWTPTGSHYLGYSDLDFLLEMDKGTMVSYHGSLSSHRDETSWLADWRIEGEKGSLTISDGGIKLYKTNIEMQITVNDEYDNRKYVLDEFITALNQNRAGETDLQDNLKTYEITQAAIESIEKHLVVNLNGGK